MARMDHVMQIGKPGEAPRIYLEDYVYTYLKRQANMEKKKYFLYGEREGSQAQEKLYIYGISDSAREEDTYFKDYYPLGLLKIRDGEKFLVGRNGQEKHITGFFVFYAPNQAMQEYLVDTSVEQKEGERMKNKPSREFSGKRLPIREKLVLPSNRFKREKKSLDFSNLIFYAGCGAVILLLGTAVSGGNGYRKLAAFKQMVLQTMNSSEEKNEEEDFIVEEQRIGGETAAADRIDVQAGTAAEMPQESVDADGTLQEARPSGEVPQIAQSSDGTSQTVAVSGETAAVSESEPAREVISEQVSSAEVSPAEKEEVSYESYIVQEGDTLVKICKTRYGSLEKMKEICEHNNIKNEDYIAPGQKLYLP